MAHSLIHTLKTMLMSSLITILLQANMKYFAKIFLRTITMISSYPISATVFTSVDNYVGTLIKVKWCTLMAYKPIFVVKVREQ